MNGKQLQDVLKQLEANTALSYYKKKLCWNKFPYICYRIFALGLSW